MSWDNFAVIWPYTDKNWLKLTWWTIIINSELIYLFCICTAVFVTWFIDLSPAKWSILTIVNLIYWSGSQTQPKPHTRYLWASVTAFILFMTSIYVRRERFDKTVLNIPTNALTKDEDKIFKLKLSLSWSSRRRHQTVQHFRDAVQYSNIQRKEANRHKLS